MHLGSCIATRYLVSQTAVHNLDRPLGVDLAHRGIRVDLDRPGKKLSHALAISVVSNCWHLLALRRRGAPVTASTPPWMGDHLAEVVACMGVLPLLAMAVSSAEFKVVGD